MNREEAIKLLKNVSDYFSKPLELRKRADQTDYTERLLKRVIELLESEPKSNQLTADIRNQANNRDIPENIIRRYLLDTCDIIDRLEAENKGLKVKSRRLSNEKAIKCRYCNDTGQRFMGIGSNGKVKYARCQCRESEPATEGIHKKSKIRYQRNY